MAREDEFRQRCKGVSGYGRADRYRRAEWTKRIERWRESGLTAKEFASETGLNVNTLQNWSWRLAAEERRGQRRPTRARVEFVEVSAAAMIGPLVGAAAPTFEVVLASGTTVRVPPGFDSAALRQLLDVVGR